MALATPAQRGQALALRAPGMLASHYAPRAPLVLRAGAWPSAARLGVLSFRGDDLPAISCAIEVLSPRGDLAEAARALFAALRRLDAASPDLIAAELLPEEGLGAGVSARSLAARGWPGRPLARPSGHNQARTARRTPCEEITMSLLTNVRSAARALLGAALTVLAIGLMLSGCGSAEQSPPGVATPATPAPAAAPGAVAVAVTVPVAATDKLELTDAQWQARLSPEVYQVLRHQETEPAFCGGYRKIEENGPGTYCCAGCGAPLFTADTKFHSGTGWPSFFQAITGAVGETHDTSHDMDRTEIHCARCGGHLGHVFTDGPAPSGLRYCVNAAAITFTPTGQPLPALAMAPGAPAAATAPAGK